MELDLTKEEKIEFVNRLNSKSIQNKLKYGRRYVTSAIFWAICGVISIVILALKIVTSMFFWPVVLLIWFFVIEDFLRGIKALIAAIKDASYGKMSYFQYRKLLKSGELGKWEEENIKLETSKVTGKDNKEQEETKEQKEIKEQDDIEKQEKVKQEVQEQESVTLTAEELAVLKKLMDKKVVKNVEEVLQTEKENTSKPNDNEGNK